MSSYSWPNSSGGSGGVTSLNTLTGDLTLAAGTGITITPSGGNTLTIAATVAPAGTSGQVQYNNAGAFGGFGSWNGTTLAITGAISSTTTMAVGTNLHVFGTSILAGDLAVQGGANFSGNLGFYGNTEVAQPTGNVLTALSSLGLVASPTLSLSNLPTQANNTILGNNSGSTGTPSALTVAQVNAILPIFTSTLNGLAPLSGGGTTNFLRADGTWTTPAGGGSVTSVGLSVPATSILSVTGSPVTGSGTIALATTGTSGGIPYFSSTSQLASSGLLTANALVLGGGAGAAPTSAGLGTTATVWHGNAAGAGSYASVNLQNDITSQLGVVNGGTGISSGTSTGIPYFSSASTIASSGALTTGNLIIGGASGPTSVSTLPSTNFPALTGDVTSSAGSLATTLAATSNSTLATLSHTAGVAITGVNTNTAASTGQIGEYIEALVGTTSGSSSTTIFDATSISLTAGDWDLYLLVNFIANSMTGNTQNLIGISTTSGNTPSGLVRGVNLGEMPTAPTAAAGVCIEIANYRQLISSTTTYFAKIQQTFVAGTPQFACKLCARRRR